MTDALTFPRFLRKITSPSSIVTKFRSYGKNWKDKEDHQFLEDLENSRKLYCFISEVSGALRNLSSLKEPVSFDISELGKKKSELGKALKLEGNTKFFEECPKTVEEILVSHSESLISITRLETECNNIFKLKDRFRNLKYKLIASERNYEKAQNAGKNEIAEKEMANVTANGKEVGELRSEIQSKISFIKLTCNEFLTSIFDKNVKVMENVNAILLRGREIDSQINQGQENFHENQPNEMHELKVNNEENIQPMGDGYVINNETQPGNLEKGINLDSFEFNENENDHNKDSILYDNHEHKHY